MKLQKMSLIKRQPLIARFRNWIAVRIFGFVWKSDEPIKIDRRYVK